MRVRTSLAMTVLAVIAGLFLIFGVLISTNSVMAAEVTIHGVVTDDGGKPIRGAIVKATSGSNSVARFTDANGRYQISGLQNGSYDVSATAWGFGPKNEKVESGQADNANFSLKPKWEFTRASTSELLTSMPEDRETQFLRATCLGCHTWYPIMQHKGMKAEEWENLTKAMGSTTGLNPGLTDAQRTYAGRILEKYFGPDAPDPTPAQVKHLEPSDPVLKATFYEFKTPHFAKLIHSIAAEQDGKGAWFTEYDYGSNRFAHLDLVAGKIKEIPVPTPNAAPHSPVIDKTGMVWITEADGNKIAMIDPATDRVQEFPLPLQEWGLPLNKPARPHSLTLDKYGNLWIDSTATSFLFFLDRETHKFQRYPAVVPKELPAESQIAWALAPGETGSIRVAGSYDIKVDSEGKVWYTELGLGALNSFDPVTKESKQYKIPGVISSRGVAVDSNDNVWFSNWDGHTIVKFDQKTGKSRQYQPPTHFATAYGLVFDNNGYLWFADYAGNQITRFDPKTEGFVEYPLPTAGAMPRFIDVDKFGRVYFCEWWQSKVGVLDPGTNGKTPVVASAK